MPKRIQESESEGSDDSSDESLDLNDSDGDSDSGGGSIDSEPPTNKKARTEETTKGNSSKKDTKAPIKKLASPPKISTKVTDVSTKSNAPIASKPSVSSSSNQAIQSTSTTNITTHTMSSTTSSGSGGDITRGPPVTTDVAAKKLIGMYLTQQNRPYSAIQVHDNLHKRIPKATVERVLSSMSSGTESGYICKEYGKAKIYFVDQNTLNSNFTPQQLDILCNENEKLKTENETRSSEERRVRTELNNLLSEPKDSEVSEIIQQTRLRVEEKLNRVAKLSTGNPATISTSSTNKSAFRTLADATAAHNQFRRAWHTRKMLCMEAVDLLSDGMGKKVKDVMAEMCLENDQDVDVTLPALLPEL